VQRFNLSQNELLNGMRSLLRRGLIKSKENTELGYYPNNLMVKFLLHLDTK
jgi:hypothetical protein